MDSFGNAAAIWELMTGGASLIQTASKPFGQNWSSPVILSFSGNMPLITLNDQGTAVATWVDSGTQILMGSRNLFLFPLMPPSDFTGKIVKNEFLTETAYFLSMKWIPSPAPYIASYQIFEDGKLIGTVSGKGPFAFLQPVDSKHVKETYTLKAVASNGNMSPLVPLEIQKK